MPAYRRSGHSPSTPSSPTWTPWQGVYFPRGGMRALPDALAAAAADAGVEFHLQHHRFRHSSARRPRHRRADRHRRTVPHRRRDSDHRTARHLPPARAHAPPAAEAASRTVCGRGARRLSRGRARRRPVATTPSCSATRGRDLRRHHRHGSADGRPFAAGHPADGRRPTLAPAGRDLLYVLAPAPNTAVGQLDWDDQRRRLHRRDAGCRHRTAAAPRRGRRTARTSSRPPDWARQGMVAGTPFALAHTFGQTGPFRPGNTVRGIDNVVLAGSSTVPGVGVPTAIISGRLAADRITGVIDHGLSHGW